MAHYLVTGSAGFIGSAVSRRLLTAGHRVTGVDDLNPSYDPRLKSWRLEQLALHPGFQFQRLDLADRPALDRFAEQLWDAPDAVPPEAILHLAARAGVRPSVTDPWTYLEVNVRATLNVLDLCRRQQVRKLVFASSSSVYGAGRDLPYREDQNTDRPLSPYAATKKMGESLAYSYHHLHGLDISLLRFFTVYGPAGRPDMSVFRFIRWIAEGTPVRLYGNGLQQRDFTYIDDISAGAVAALRPVGYEIFNLGGEHPVAMEAVLQEISQLIGRPAKVDRQPAHPADVAATWADINKARKLLDWSPEVSLSEGLRRTVAWYFAEESWARQLELEGLPATARRHTA